MDKLDTILNMLKELDSKVTNGFEEINLKLDTIKSQTASNTEYQYDIKQIDHKVNELEVDVKLIKKAITNQ